LMHSLNLSSELLEHAAARMLHNRVYSNSDEGAPG
jgi:hypothetical protein